MIGPLPMTPRQEKWVISEQFFRVIQKHQRMEGLEPSGLLNYPTLESFSAAPIGKYLETKL